MMDAILQTIDITQLTASGLLTIAILMMFKGNLVVKVAYDEVRTDRDNWKQAFFDQQKTNQELTTQVGQLLEYARTADHVLRSLPRPEGEPRASSVEQG